MEKSMSIAVAAVVISIVAVLSSIALRPATLAPEVTTDELAGGSVTGDKIATGAVGTDKIADNAITADKIAENAIPEFFIGDNSITSAKIQDGTITNVDVSSAAAIDLSKLATYPFGLADLAANSVDGTKIVDGSVTSADIQDGTIQTTDIAAGALTQTAENFGEWGVVDNTTAVWTDFENLDDARVEITTTGNNPVLIIFSGVFSNNTDNGRVRISLMINDEWYWWATRTGTSSTAGDPFVLAFNCMPTLPADTHTIQVVWCVMGAGEEGSAYNRVLDVIELKR